MRLGQCQLRRSAVRFIHIDVPIRHRRRRRFDQRAAEYDGWWPGTGSLAERERPGWSAEVEQLIGVVRALPPARVLDVASGTGFLIQHLRGELVALDHCPAAIRERRRGPASYVRARTTMLLLATEVRCWSSVRVTVTRKIPLLA
jgi:SAM-dependent methyltransferase